LGRVKKIDFELFALGIEVDVLIKMKIEHESGSEFFKQMIVMDRSSAQMNEFEAEGFNDLILKVEDLNEDLFGIETFGMEFELSLMNFF
jgi:hypothetical protein